MRSRMSSVLPLSLSVLAAVAVLTAAPRAGAAPSPVPPNFDSSVMHGNEAEDAIAINPTNPSNIVTMATLPDVPSGLFEGVTFDGGKTWRHLIIGTADPLGQICCDQQLAWDRFGNLWMAYLVNTNGNVLVAVSTDGGLSFAKVAEVVPTTPTGSKAPSGATPRRLRSPSNNPNILGDQPSISAGPDSVWISYTTFPSTVVQAFGASVTGLGAFGSFTAPQSVPTSAGRGDFGDTAVGPDGQVMVIYQDHTNGVGEANLGWDHSGGPHSGRVYAIWTQESPNGSNNTDILLQYSDDGGTTWTAPVRLNDDQTANSQFMPAIAVDQSTGDVAVSWYDCRNDLGTGGTGDTDGIPNDDAQIWATYSTDGGVAFAPNFRVSAGAFNATDAQSFFDYGDYTHAAFGSHLFYPAWSDNSGSTGQNPDGTLHQLDLFTAKVVIR